MYGVAALSDGSVVLVGGTEGDYAGENAGGKDFVVVKLTSAGVVDWSWQVRGLPQLAIRPFRTATTLSVVPWVFSINPTAVVVRSIVS